MAKSKSKALSKKIARIGSGMLAVGRNYEKHAKEIDTFAKKIKSEWNSGKGKK